MERHQGCGVRGHRGRAAEGSCVGWAGCSGRGQVRGVEVAVCWVPVSPGSAGGTRGTVDVLGKQGALGRTVSPPPRSMAFGNLRIQPYPDAGSLSL